jgi:hypothetical protein
MDLKVPALDILEPNTELDLAKLFDAIQGNAKKKLSKPMSK